ncbi:MAG: 2-amino-4-hydroxy-6-hydroxymethyldihydropteridine diphosphokinase [Planctomycetota bacterium]
MNRPASNPRTLAALAIGGNLGDVERTFKGALARLDRAPGVTILRRSDWIRTAAEGGPAGQPEYLNGALLVETTLTAEALLELCQELERHFGRDRADGVRNGPRTLDLDVLWFGEQVRQGEPLHLPHPRLTQRRFVLEPLAQIAPDAVIPGTGRTVAQHLAALVATPSPTAP